MEKKFIFNVKYGLLDLVHISYFFVSLVIILAMKYKLAREVVYFAGEIGMNNGDYAFIVFELSTDEVKLNQKEQLKWFKGNYVNTTNVTASFKQAFESVLVMAVNVFRSKVYEEFNYNLKIKASEEPFYSNSYRGYIRMPWGELRNKFDTPVRYLHI